ncbi:MAG: hypothetical protein M1829_000576 [Trizodia sp. TS-e1964]|nr:MAG: hypothetical protein M1829_000576 [Trizodia sp. TS-e1964]
MLPAPLGETIAIVDRSGKVISTSQHIFGIFKEAKSAYLERKAEIAAQRQAENGERQARRALRQPALEDDRSVSTRDSRRTKHKHQSRVPRRFEESANSYISPSLREDHSTNSGRPKELTRRRSIQNEQTVVRAPITRATTAPVRHIDMDLAYGDVPPPLAVQDPDLDLTCQLSKLTLILDEAHCIHHSATAIISSLQSNPDALAAVALTLAEISNILSKMAPGALMGIKGSFPAVFALLASPQFAIAVGVGVGVTIVALGGYKIIKKIRTQIAEDEEQQDQQLQEIGSDVSRIEMWRRGIAEEEAKSVATSVDGEFITPEAAAMKRVVAEERVKKEEGRRKHRSSTSKSYAKSTRQIPKSKTSKSEKHEEGAKKVKVKKPSTLRLLFR